MNLNTSRWLSIISTQNRKPVLLASVAAAFLLTGCGSGSGGSSSKNDENQPDDDWPQPKLTEFTQATCLEIDAYQWLDDRCTLKGNPEVQNLHAIQALPEQDREDILKWLARIDKPFDLELMLPRWDESVPADSLPFSLSESDHTLDEPDFYLDEHLFQNHLKHGRIVNDGQLDYVLGRANLHYSITSNLSRKTRVELNGAEMSKQVSLNIKDGNVRLEVNGLEVYSLHAIKQIPVNAVLGKVPATVFTELSMNYGASEDEKESFLDTRNLTALFNQQIQVTTQDIDSLATLIGIEKNQTKKLIVAADKQASAYQISFFEEADALAQTQYVSHENKNIYYVMQDSTQIEVGEKKTIGATGWFTPVVTIPDAELVDLTLGFDISVALTVKQNQLQHYLFEPKEMDVSLIRTKPRTLDAYKTALLNREQVLKQYFSKANGISELHQPGFNTLTAPLRVLLPLDHFSSQKTFSQDDELLAVMLKYSEPDYSQFKTPTLEERLAFNGWDEALWETLNHRLYNKTKAELLSELESLDNLLGTSLGGSDFHANIFNELKNIFENLEEAPSFFIVESMIDAVVGRGYVNKPLSVSDYLTIEELNAAIAVSGQWLGEALSDEISNLDNFQYDTFNNQWSESPLNLKASTRIRKLPEWLQADPELHDKIQQHDLLASVYGITLISEDVLQYLEKLDANEVSIDRDIEKLNAIEAFFQKDSTNGNSGYITDFKKLAKLAYKYEWNTQTFGWLESLNGFLFKPEYCFSSETVTESFECYRLNDELKSTVIGEGYFASQADGKNTYVENAQAFKELFADAEALKEKSVFKYSKLNPKEQVKEGMWLSCSTEGMTARLQSVLEIVNDLVKREADDDWPSREEMSERSKMVEEVVELYKTDCAV